MSYKIDKKQIKVIRALAAKIFDDDDAYRDWLTKNFFRNDARKSTTELTQQEGREAIEILMRFMPPASKPAAGGNVSRYKGSDDGVHLTKRQAYRISFLETALGWQDNFARLQGFIFKQTGKNQSVEMLSKGEASKVITGLEKMTGESA